MVVIIEDKAARAGTIADAVVVGHRTEQQTEIITLAQSLALARREIGVLKKALENNKIRIDRDEVSITATAAQFVALQEEKVALLAEVAELRKQLISSETARTSEVSTLRGQLTISEASRNNEVASLRDQLSARERSRTEVSDLLRERAEKAREVTLLRDLLAMSENNRISEASRVMGLQKEKTALAEQSAKLRQKLASLERRLSVLQRSVSWRITIPLRFVKLPTLWRKRP